MNWTDKQLSAINTRDKNLLVAAAAGSGKTAVLVERIVQLIISGDFDVDKMLIVTFTNAAAQEMRTRIHKAITERIASVDDSDLITKLERQSILLSGASITTFHAFCLSVLRRHFAKIDLDPKFREGDEHELNILKQEVIEELFERKYEQHDAAFIKFTDEFGGNVQGDSDLHKLIINLHDFSQSRPYPKDWLNSLVGLYENPDTFKLDNGSTWLEYAKDFALQQAKSVIQTSLASCSEAMKISDSIFQSHKIRIGEKNFSDDLSKLQDILNALNDWDRLVEKVQLIKFIDFDRRKIPDDIKFVKDDLRNRRDDYKSSVKTLSNKLLTTPTAEIIAEMKNLAESVRQLVNITIEFDKAFAAAKRDKNIIDFDDMQHLALKIFNTDAHTAAIYRDKFKIIMVDEYQDTNGVQEEIINKIVGSNNFFAVGDVKQSIYRFRNADPEIFLDKYKTYPVIDSSARIDLSTNFRSRSKVVDAVNAIFKQLMISSAMEIDYDDDAKLNFGANYPAGRKTLNEPAELCIINLNKETRHKSDDEDDSENLQVAADDKLEREIQLIANKINVMINAGKNIWDKDSNNYRPIEFRDVVILLRSMDGTAAKIVEVLRRNKIPAYAADKDGYFRANEIQTILSLLKILDNSRQDIPLATVMLSPIGGFSTEDLAKLRISDRNADLYTLVSGSDSCKAFIDKINRWREMARQMSVPELLSAIYRETGYYDYFGRQVDGKIPQANLRMLIDRAAAYEKTAFRGLSRFVQFIKKIKDLGNDLSAARTLSESENVVRVMTIHKSKGLEFPVVFVAQLGKQFNMQDLRETVIPHRNLGIGIYQTVEGSNIRTPTFARRIIARKAKAEMLAEELRILYVAFTRAREKLIMIGSANNTNAIEKYDNLDAVPAHTLQNVMRPLDWLLMVKNFVDDVVNVEIIDAKNIAITAGENVVDKIDTAKPLQPVEKVAELPLESIPAKLSVTEIKRRINAEEFEIDTAQLKVDRQNIYRRPNFLKAKEISGAEFGTIMHSVMQHLNLKGDLTRAGIVGQIDEMISRQILTAEQGETAKRKAGNIEKFFTSNIGQNIISAKEIYRELPFNRIIDAGSISIFKNAAGEQIFIQGIIDVLFKDAAGNWILLDYKTDRNNTDEYFQREYREQINMYVQAVEAIVHLKVAAKYLYLLVAGRLIDMN